MTSPAYAQDLARPARHEAKGVSTDRSDATSRIGNTPLIRLRRITLDLPRGLEIWVKAEFFNPGGSVKDRTALFIVRDAVERGRLSDGRVLIDASSGNTGIAYSFLGAVLGFPVEIVLPGNASAERKRRILAHGAKITLSSPLEGTDGAQRLAKSLAEEFPDRYYYPDQYNNDSNPLSHYSTTGPEIWGQTGGRVTHFVAGVGTGGTISGAGRFLKEKDPSVRVIGVIPDNPIHAIEGLKHLETCLRPGTLDESVIDSMVEVSTEDSLAMARRLAREEGLFAGTSSGAAVHAALQLARSIPSGIVVTVLPDGGDRYVGEPYVERED